MIVKGFYAKSGLMKLGFFTEKMVLLISSIIAMAQLNGNNFV